MNELEAQIQHIYTGLAQLKQEHAQMKKENSRLQQLLESQNKTEQAAQARIDQLQLQLDVIKFTTGEMPEAAKAAFHKKITRYIKDIDRTIAELDK